MASAFGHAVLAATIGVNFSKKFYAWKFWLVGAICTILPDADVISFKFGIPYESFWGHRGFSHSLLFAAIVGLAFVLMFYRKHLSRVNAIGYFLFFTLCTASHSILDAMTTGGLGVAFFSPWDNTRYFFPWRPIKVSPIVVSNFFSEWGKNVLLSEFIWIGLPSLVYISVMRLVKRRPKGRL